MRATETEDRREGESEYAASCACSSSEDRIVSPVGPRTREPLRDGDVVCPWWACVLSVGLVFGSLWLLVLGLELAAGCALLRPSSRWGSKYDIAAVLPRGVLPALGSSMRGVCTAIELRRYARRALLSAGARGDEADGVGAADMDALLLLLAPSCLKRSSTGFGRAPCGARGGRSDATEPDRVRPDGAHASVSGIGGGDVAVTDG